MRRRSVNVFSLSFLDAITCGFGAIVLFYMVITASVGLRAERVTGDRRGEVDRLEEEVLDGHKRLVVLRNSVSQRDRELMTTRGLSRRVLESLEALEQELATWEGTSLARREHLNRLKTDLKTLETDVRRLSALAPSDETPGDRVRAFVGDGDRQYLTGLKLGGRRIFVLVNASASMLDETIVNVIRRRYLPDELKLKAEKWRQAVATVDWLTTQLPPGSLFQIYCFDESARPVIEGTERQWLDAGDRAVLDEAVLRLRQTVPRRGTSLHHGLAALRAMDPAPDNLILLVDGLPTLGAKPSRKTKVSGKQRLKLYDEAIRQLPSGLPVNVILFPMEGDPMASSSYWKLALATGGSYLSPAKDWP